jgi:hypothetical protein
MSIYKNMFDGSDYVPERDNERLNGQIKRIHALMIDGLPRTLSQIASVTGDPEASVSAQLRNLKKERFGSYRLEKDYKGNGLFAYRLLPPIPSGQGVLDV